MEECAALGVWATGLTGYMADGEAAKSAVDRVVAELERLTTVVCNVDGGTIQRADELPRGAKGVNTTGTPSNRPYNM